MVTSVKTSVRTLIKKFRKKERLADSSTFLGPELTWAEFPKPDTTITEHICGADSTTLGPDLTWADESKDA